MAHRLLVRGLEDGAAWPRLQVVGACMEPLIRHGDWVTVSPRVEPEPGDVVVAWPPGGDVVCHRVLQRDTRGFLLAGDRSSVADHVAPGDLVGRVEEIERHDRSMVLAPAGAGWVDRQLTMLHRLSVASRGRSTRPAWAGRAIEALRRRLRSAYSSFTTANAG